MHKRVRIQHSRLHYNNTNKLRRLRPGVLQHYTRMLFRINLPEQHMPHSMRRLWPTVLRYRYTVSNRP